MVVEKEYEILELIKTPQTTEAGYRMLLQEYQQQLYWQIRKLVIDHDDAHDVLQNVFVKVFKGIKNFKGDSKLSSWLYRIAYNESMTFLTKKGKQLQIDNSELQAHLVDQLEADVYFTGDEIQLALQKALAQLPKRQSEIFKMRYYDEVKFKDIAALLELSEGAVKSSYHIAAKKIEQFIKQD
ncbi:RNA polymerase sigma factor [Nonlabens mediterrranea]|uniref:RNA polymerase sigma factor n=1 Tax=Nonlabens mediterrranea TaxID=1419947 RepID=A0ABS0A9D5_9FLAO|nr:RNA polymerase sigma-70 factor [Flavobacteria bacterium BBFL7]MBF4985945.1 RNA polymerase sigma factor [Nonlabens mediterrranea]